MHEVFPKQQLKHIQAGVEPLLGAVSKLQAV